jgi:hypothetical protein
MSAKNEYSRWRFVDGLFVVACIALSAQLFPAVYETIGLVIDVRRWPSAIWLLLNVVVVLVLVCLQFGPDLYQQWRARKSRLAADLEKRQRQQKLKEEKEMFERLRQARSRRLY